MKKLLLTFFAALLMTANVWADASGTCGSNLNWKFNSSTGKLTITGSGAMTSWGSSSYVPWYSVRSQITSVSLPSGLTSIGQWAFNGCSHLESISIPSTVTQIGVYTFRDCAALSHVYVHRITPPSINGYTFYNVVYDMVTLHVPNATSSAYSVASYWNYFESLVEMPPYASLTSEPTAIAGLVRNGTTHALVNAGTAENGTVYYSLDAETWSASVPTGTLAGDYTVYYRVVADAGYTDYDPYPCSVNVSIALKYATTVASGTQDAANWEMTPAFADAGQTVTIDYNGDLRPENLMVSRAYSKELTANSSNIATQVADFNRHTGSKLVLTSDISGDQTFTAINGEIDMNGHTQANRIYIQNNIEGNAIILKNGTISDEIDGHGGWGDWYQGTVILENMNMPTSYAVWTDGHAYIINGGTYKQIQNYTDKEGVCPGTVVIYDGKFINSFNNVTVNSNSNYRHGTYTLYGGKYAFDPTALSCTVVIPDGFSVQSNTDSDNGTYPYVVKSNSPSVTPPSYEHDYQLTETVTGHQWTLTMPAYDVEVAVTYYPLATLTAAPTAVDDLVYDGSAQELITAGTAENGTMKYSLDNSIWSEEIPTATNAGDYTVYYKVFGDPTHSNYTPASNTVAVTIDKANPIVTAPTAKSLTYTGDEQELINPGSTTGGTLEYYEQGSVMWEASIPTATNAGTYTVKYQVTGDANYNNVSSLSLPSVVVTIEKADVSYTAPTAISGLEYTGAAQTLITAGSAEGGEMQYKLGNGAWSTSLPTATDADDYTVWYKVIGDANHNNVAETSILVSIAAPSAMVLTANPDPDPTHTGVYYSTFYHSAVAYELSAGVEAYVAELSGDALNMTKIAEGGQVIPMDNAVILKSNSGSITLTPSDATPVTFTATNNLHGVDEPTAAPANCYVLSGHSSDNSVTGVGFYQYTGTLKAHKAYAVISGAAYAPKKLRFVFNQEQTTTDIEGIQPSEVRSQKVIENGVLYIIKNGVRYNAQGQIVK